MSVLDPAGSRLPIKVDTTTNGEFAPTPLPRVNVFGNELAHKRANDISRHLGCGRRDFLVSTAGAAATLMAFNDAHAAAGGAGGGFFDLPKEAAWQTAAADTVLKGDEFVFDIQGHHVNPIAKWRNPNSSWAMLFKELPNAHCKPAAELGDYGHLNCVGQNSFVKELFLDSDTSMGVLTFVPSLEEDMPLSTADAAETQAAVDALDGTKRLLLHGRVIPNLPGDIDRMASLLKRWKISAWKTYTQFNEGWWLDDERYGVPFLENARSLGLPLVCVHKGLPLPPMGDKLQFSRADDVGRAARKFKDITFIIYHSAYDNTIVEGAFVPGSKKGGVDSLIQSLIDNGIPPNSNVYAELGTTWRDVMKKPDEAAHLLGKLIKYVGEDRVVWGTDSIWYGSPQDQIQAFRAFQISNEFCDKYGYAKLTPAVKRKILGLNAAVPYKIEPKLAVKRASNDVLSKAKALYAQAPDPSFLTYGPKTRSEFLRLLRMEGVS